MILFGVFEEIDDLLHFSFTLMQTSYIIELDIDIFNDIEFLGLGPDLRSSSHAPFRGSDYGTQYEENKHRIHYLINTIKCRLKAAPSYVLVLNVALLCNIC